MLCSVFTQHQQQQQSSSGCSSSSSSSRPAAAVASEDQQQQQQQQTSKAFQKRCLSIVKSYVCQCLKAMFVDVSKLVLSMCKSSV
jgi:hypothetical protein